jgi:hypothetical protein
MFVVLPEVLDGSEVMFEGFKSGESGGRKSREAPLL